MGVTLKKQFEKHGNKKWPYLLAFLCKVLFVGQIK